MNLPEEYKTGNPGMDKRIIQALQKEGKQKRVKQLIHSALNGHKGDPRISVTRKEERTDIDGTLFASKNEMIRWHELLLYQKAGQISDLKKQVPFVLCKGDTHPQYGEIKPVLYVADFAYYNLTYRKEFPNRYCVEDSKTGVRTDIYKIKRRMFLVKYSTILFFEV